jgi:hypothetical protein
VKMALPRYPSTSGAAREEYRIMESRVYDAMEAATADSDGILRAAFDTPTDFQEFIAHPLDEDHELLLQPASLGATPTAVQGQQYTANMNRYLEQQKALKTFKTALIQSLDEEALSLITEPPPFGTRRRSIHFILTTLREAYGILTAADLVQLKLRLRDPYPPATPIRDYIRKHRDVHHVCASAQQAMAEADKVQALRRGVKHVPMMATAVQHFVTMQPTVAGQSFDLLATLLGQAEDNGEPEPTTGTSGYAAASVNTPPVTMADLDRKIAELRAEFLQVLAIAPDKHKKLPTQYCWTHGACAHSSQACTYPAAGHVTTATASNPQGGAANRSKYANK